MAPFIHLQFLGSSLTFMMVYVWGRRNPFGAYFSLLCLAPDESSLLLQGRSCFEAAGAHLRCYFCVAARMNLLGVFTFTAPYLP
jgi:hypothetical protein